MSACRAFAKAATTQARAARQARTAPRVVDKAVLIAGAVHEYAQRIEQAAHPRRGDRQRPARRCGVQGQVKLTLPGRQPLPRRSLQQLQLRIIVGRADVLDIPRPAMGGVDDLHGRCA